MPISAILALFLSLWPLVGVSSNPATPQEVAQLIVLESERQQFPDPLLALAIARAESGLNPRAKNPNSSATGIFQFIKSTWERNCYGNPYDAEDNIRCGIALLKTGAHNHWLASQWGKNGWYRSYTEATLQHSRMKLAALGLE